MVASMPPNPVGYLTRYEDGLHGERGTYYTYITAGNGVFVEAEGPLLAGRVPVSWGEVRGLAPDEVKLVLRHGKLPYYIWEDALGQLVHSVSTELFIAVTRNGDKYDLVRPHQERSPTRVKYSRVENTVLDLHSHHGMPAFFSSTDNADETGFQLYGVIGALHHANKLPQVHLRVGIYGHHWSVPWSDVFQGELEGFQDLGAITGAELEALGLSEYHTDLPSEPHRKGPGQEGRRSLVKGIRDRLSNMGLWTP